MKIENNIITADEGKILRRISDRQEFGKQVHLGYTYYLDGELLDEKLLELPEHFEEIDEEKETAEDAEVLLLLQPLGKQIDGHHRTGPDEAPPRCCR